MQPCTSGSSSSSASGQPDVRWQQQQQRSAAAKRSTWQSPRRHWHSSIAAAGSHFGLLHSDATRQRRLVASAAAADPALAGDAWDENALELPLALQRSSSTQRWQPGRPKLQPYDFQPGGQPLDWQAAGTAGTLLPARAPLPLPVAGSLLALPHLAAAAAPAAQPFRLPVPNLGYTCMNVQLQQSFGIRTNRWAADMWAACCCRHEEPLPAGHATARPLCPLATCSRTGLLAAQTQVPGASRGSKADAAMPHANPGARRSCRRKTFEAKGLEVVSILALANCRDLLSLVQWNKAKVRGAAPSGGCRGQSLFAGRSNLCSRGPLHARLPATRLHASPGSLPAGDPLLSHPFSPVPLEPGVRAGAAAA